ncbi:hypothetical protein BDP81DRAFT_455566 [Colletotrichum phormii]|uniref:Heterokaryon incompatibility domain-containing protein n=1 Tax=Colletotrichum phormii TaxID=359342 RepID=A0AAI9ZCW1_9PEZI|nr:uncharacterized protein BDP81DRAFT_455566 [Colletotrichum phormii]KAK1622163.1 hypothetical protein BDP81DRAFT_455566 [Colletotrichum phormii]
MRHIYFRAHTVVVWLGSTYSQYQKGIGPLEARFAPEDSSVEETLTSATGPSEPDDAHAVSLKSERKMVLRLAKDEYWNRVWIIQEIGHARQRRVCFGKMELSWSGFIKMMTHHSVTTEGPLRLNQQVEQKYQGSHTLRRLLSDHRNSQCQDPKDKIFGLIGLSVDGYGYPSPDYDKSLFQIWTETMEFMNRHKMFDDNNELEIVSHANLVKFLLMGTRCTPIQQVLRPYAAEAETQLSLGPSVKDVAGNLGKVDEWSHKVQINYEDDLGSACKQSNKLLGALLGEQTEEVLQLCSNQLSLVSWEAHFQMNCPLFPFLNWDDRPKHKLVPIESPNHSEPSSHISTKNSGASETLLYQLWTGHRSNQSPRWKMGVASCQAALGDVVCWVGGTKTALVVRPTEGYRSPHQRYVENVQLQVIDTAMVAEDIADSMIDHSLRLNIRGKRGEHQLDQGVDAEPQLLNLVAENNKEHFDLDETDTQNVSGGEKCKPAYTVSRTSRGLAQSRLQQLYESHGAMERILLRLKDLHTGLTSSQTCKSVLEQPRSLEFAMGWNFPRGVVQVDFNRSSQADEISDPPTDHPDDLLDLGNHLWSLRYRPLLFCQPLDGQIRTIRNPKTLNYIAFAIGITISSQAGGSVMDYVFRRLRYRANGATAPEFLVAYLVIETRRIGKHGSTFCVHMSWSAMPCHPMALGREVESPRT